MHDGKAEVQVDTKREPEFQNGLVVTTSALVVDNRGRAWWVCPESRTITPAL